MAPATATATKTADQQAPLPLEVLEPGAAFPMRRDDAADEVMLTQRADESLIEALTRLENAAEVFKRRAELLEACHLAALKRTRPSDWVLTRDRQDAETAMLTVSGADLVAEVYGIVIRNIGPTNERGEFTPEKTPVKGLDGVYSLRAHCSAFSRVNGRAIELLEFTRRSDEDFTGRSIASNGRLTTKPTESVGALESDLRGAVLTGMRTKVVRVLCGMTRVPVSELAKAWEGTEKKVEQCRRGHGYGTSSERTSRKLSGNLDQDKRELWEELLRRTGGDKGEASTLLCDITTSDDGQYKGYTSVDRIAKDFLIKRAWDRLPRHPRFGDQAQQAAAGREPGADDEQ